MAESGIKTNCVERFVRYVLAPLVIGAEADTVAANNGRPPVGDAVALAPTAE